MLYKNYKFPSVTLRPFLVYGPYQETNRLIPFVIKSCLNNKTFDLIGWQNTDIYQNFNITFLSSIRKNRVLAKNLFILPSQN